MLDRLNTADWGLPKTIISDRDRKFLSELWRAIFSKLGVLLLYSTAYHAQTDEQTEIFNQIAEIALRFYLATMKNPANWPDVLPKMQRHINNSQSSATSKTPNEAAYGFTPVQPLDLWKSPAAAENLAADLEEPSAAGARKPFADASFSAADRARVEVADSIAFAQMNAKYYYDRKHQPMFMKIDDYAHIRLHHGYDIPSTATLDKKLSQQYVSPFKILKKVERLAYRLDLPSHWRIHPVLSVAQLKPATSPSKDPFRRPRPEQPDSVHVEGDTEQVKS